MISKTHQFIFIHNFKTGGTSIEKKLGHFDVLTHDVQDHRTLREIELLTDRNLFFKKSLYAIKKGKLNRVTPNLNKAIFPDLTKNEFNNFYKFTFVRNTWARMYSWYANVLKDEHMRSQYGIDNLDYSFKNFLLEKIDHKTFSQLYFIKDKAGTVPMDFIGRFENLQNDFNVVCKALSIEDTELPKMLVRKYSHYTENYTEETKLLVHKLYKDEIDYFNFEFGA